MEIRVLEMALWCGIGLLAVSPGAFAAQPVTDAGRICASKVLRWSPERWMAEDGPAQACNRCCTVERAYRDQPAFVERLRQTCVARCTPVVVAERERRRETDALLHELLEFKKHEDALIRAEAQSQARAERQRQARIRALPAQCSAWDEGTQWCCTYQLKTPEQISNHLRRSLGLHCSAPRKATGCQVETFLDDVPVTRKGVAWRCSDAPPARCERQQEAGKTVLCCSGRQQLEDPRLDKWVETTAYGRQCRDGKLGGGNSLAPGAVVGTGSVCARKGPPDDYVESGYVYRCQSATEPPALNTRAPEPASGISSQEQKVLPDEGGAQGGAPSGSQSGQH